MSGRDAEMLGQIGRRHVGRLAIEPDAGLLQRSRDKRNAAVTAGRHGQAIAERDAGSTHRNAAVVKAQVDFITGKVPDAEIVIHPYSGEAGAIGAALCAADAARTGGQSRFRGFAAVEALTYRSTTSDQTVCHWCSCNCKRTFIDVQLPGAAGRPWSKIPVPEGWQRVIGGNSCPKGLMEDVDEMRTVKARIDEAKRAYPNVAEVVRATAFHRA